VNSIDEKCSICYYLSILIPHKKERGLFLPPLFFAS